MATIEKYKYTHGFGVFKQKIIGGQFEDDNM
jgi:hypothetical protein